MSFIESPRFPGCPSFGFSGDPTYDVSIIETASGRETRNRNWSRPLMLYSVLVGPRREVDIQECRDFYHVAGGTARGFRLKDYTDYKSCRVNETASALDQPLIETADSPGIYQMVKTYDVGAVDEDNVAITQDREIYKPVQGTILIAANGVTLTETTHYVIDYTRGTVDFVGSPSSPLTWGGEFDVPVRFNSGFPVEILNRQIQSVQFILREIRAGLE
jgi:uncharacterized protein (TIGR02217 family)